MMYTEEAAYAAMCLWEAHLEHPKPDLADLGAVESRFKILAAAQQCEDAWKVHQPDGCYDWEWCPAFYALALDSNLDLVFKTPEEAAEYIKENW